MYIEDYNDNELLAQAQILIRTQQAFSDMPLLLTVDSSPDELEDEDEDEDYTQESY